MRAREFLKEDAGDLSVPQLKKEIVGQVKTINDFGVLDRIYQVLSQKGNRTKIERAFTKNTKAANVGVNIDKVIDDMVGYINNLPGTTQQKLDFVEALEKGKAINVKALLAKTSTFSDVFHSKFAEDFFVSIANYGRGAAMKGPGEFALAIMSPKISLAAKGDIEVNGKLVEVKAAVNTSGGRMGETGDGAPKERIVSTIINVGKKHLNDDKAKIAQLEQYAASTTSTLRPAVRALHEILGKPAAVKAVVKAVVALTFGAKIGEAVGKAAAKDSSGVMAEQEYMKPNFNWYQRKDGFSEILAIWFGGKKTFSFADGDELLQLRASGVFGAAGISIIPSKPNEIFAQINFTKGRGR